MADLIQQPSRDVSPELTLVDSSERLQTGRANAGANKLDGADRAAHDWYRFVLSYPPHLVRQYLERFDLGPNCLVLDPFCGTGTTLVECKKRRVPGVGLEANPMAHFASQVKLDWTPAPDELVSHSREIAHEALALFELDGVADLPLLQARVSPDSGVGLRTLSPDLENLLLSGSISPLPLHKALVLHENILSRSEPSLVSHETLALAKVLVHSISNLRFGPEVGVGPRRPDAPVVASWLEGIYAMARDLRELGGAGNGTPAKVFRADAREMGDVLAPGSIDAVITSPPYPNEKDYTRTTRLESVLLGFIRSKDELRALKRTLVRSNSRGAYIGDEDDRWVETHPTIQQIAAEIERRRIDMGKTSGFERMYARVTKLYFGGMARHLAGLRPLLRPGARLAYVVGDQASYLRVMIRTGEILADIADRLGYEVVGIDLFRTRLATATGEQLREEVVVLRWPGRTSHPAGPAAVNR